MDSADKATGKAMSSAYKSAIIQAFCIPTSGSDPDAETHELAGPAEAAKPQPAKLEGKPLDALLAATKEKVGACASESGLNALWIKTIAGLDLATQSQLKAIFKNRKKVLLQPSQSKEKT
jgi:hypothetical protein